MNEWTLWVVDQVHRFGLHKEATAVLSLGGVVTVPGRSFC